MFPRVDVIDVEAILVRDVDDFVQIAAGILKIRGGVWRDAFVQHRLKSRQGVGAAADRAPVRLTASGVANGRTVSKNC